MNTAADTVPLTCKEFTANMVPSIRAMQAKMGKREQLDAEWVATKIFEQMRLSGWILTKRPPAPPHSTGPMISGSAGPTAE